MQQHNSEDVQLFDALEMGHFLIIEIWLIDDVELFIRIMFKLLKLRSNYLTQVEKIVQK